MFTSDMLANVFRSTQALTSCISFSSGALAKVISFIFIHNLKEAIGDGIRDILRTSEKRRLLEDGKMR